MHTLVFIFILVGAVIVSCAIYAKCHPYSGEPFIVGILTSIAIAIILMVMVIYCADTTRDISEKLIGDVPLMSVHSDSYTSGSGGFLSFVVSTDDYYRYYYKNEETGAIKQGKVSAEQAEIYYTNEKPHLASYEVRKVKRHKKAFLYWDYCWSEKYYKFYIPEGSVIEEFKFE